MDNRLTQRVKAYAQRGRELATNRNSPNLWRFMPDRLSVLSEQRERAWRAYWRAIYLQTYQELHSPSISPDPEVPLIVDWAVQTIDLHSMGLWDPYPDQLPWERLCKTYTCLSQGPPNLLLFAPLFGGYPPGTLRPTQLWTNMWIWPSPSTYPPVDPWQALPSPYGLLRSPYQILRNVLKAFPHQFDNAWDLTAEAFLTYQIPLVLDPKGSIQLGPETILSGMQEISKTLVALRLALEGSWSVPSILAVVEPFLGNTPISRWETAVGPIRNPSDSGIIDPAQFRLIANWRRKLDLIPWRDFPILPFIREGTIQGLGMQVRSPEQYVASNYIEYALVLWDLTYGRSSTETILNAWSLLELLLLGTTKDIKRRVKSILPDTTKVITDLAELRMSFGHGRIGKDKRPRHLFGDEIPRIRALLQAIMQKIVTEVGRDPAKYEDRDAISKWVDSLNTEPP